MTAAKTWLQRLALGLLVLVLGLATLTWRAVVVGERAMQQSDRAFDAGNVREAAVHARSAALAYAPGAPHVRLAYDRLLAVATGAEAAHDTEVALFAWRALRGAALETRHFRRVHESELEASNRALARLQLGSEAPLSSREALRARKVMLQVLTKDSGTHASWVLLLVFGFVSAAAGLSWFSARGLRSDGAIRWPAASFGLALLVVGTVCWTWAVVTA